MKRQPNSCDTKSVSLAHLPDDPFHILLNENRLPPISASPTAPCSSAAIIRSRQSISSYRAAMLSVIAFPTSWPLWLPVKFPCHRGKVRSQP